ncbi:MAG: ATP-binding cassette domain-containing protein [Lachnospiraceae bacterium]
MPYILRTNHLTKTIGGKELVKDVSIHIKKGEIYGFLGPNGAGKTTIMKMLTNLWKPTDGTVEIFGETLTPKSYEVLKRMGSIIEFPTFYDHMTGYENLELHAEYMGYYNHGSIENALDLLELSDAAGKPVKNYSLGMKERLGIARAILCKPELLILDEPTNGLDPAGMKQIRIYDSQFSTQELSKILALNDVPVAALGKKAETLEDYFLKITEEVKA